MYAVVNNGSVVKQLRPGQSFVHPTSSVQYAAGWWRATTATQKAAINIYPIVDTGTKKDSNYYTNSAGSLSYNESDSQVEKPYTATAKDVDDIKDTFDVNARTYGILQGTDWYIVREIETETAAPSRVLQFRRDVRNLANNLESELDAVTEIGTYDSDDNSILKFVSNFSFPSLDDSDYDSTDDADYDSDLALNL